MNGELISNAQVYILKINNENVGFIAVTHFPHPKNKMIKKIHRLVIMPDFQGIGLGKTLLDYVADIYFKQGFDVNIVTSAKNLCLKLKLSDNWILFYHGRQAPITSKSNLQHMKTYNSASRITYSFQYRGEK